jgi:signal transduction histidine kinase
VFEALTCNRWVPLSVGALAVLTAATAYADYGSGQDGRLLAVDLTVGIVACCLLPRLFRWPVTTTSVAVALVLAALAAVAPTGTPASTAATLHVARNRPFPVAVGVALAGIAAHAVRGLWRPITGISYGWWLVLMIVSHAALVGWGALAKARGALIASLEDRARRAEAEQGRRIAEARAAERTRIAGEMHDVLAHRLSLLATYAGALEYRPDHPPERLSQAAGVIRAGVHQALDELRDVITLLRDDTADEGLQRPVPALTDLPELIEESRAIGTPVDVLDTLVDPAALPGPTGRTAYRVLQEALTNARKHATGQPVHITLAGTPGARLLIDVCNPLAIDPAPATIPGAGTGLVGLTERVRLAGGQLDHQATTDEFRLHAWLPWPA